MPTFTKKKDTLYRARRATFPKLPSHRRDLEIPVDFQTTDSGEQFLFVNDGTEDRILGFSTMDNLRHLAAADTIFGDGTFCVVPNLFYQLYTFHAMVDNKMYPLVYLLLPDKKTYLRAFRLVKTAVANRGLQLDPQIIQVEDVFLQTIGNMPADLRCTRLADYMTTFWMEGDLHLDSWNHHNTIVPRTNNHLEGWHGRLKKIISKAHPNVFELMAFLKGEQRKCEITLVQIEAGHPLPPRKKRYTNMDRRIASLKDRIKSLP